MSEKDNSVSVNLALWIKEICTALTTDLNADDRVNYEEDLNRLLLVLAGQMPSEAIDAILAICAEIPDKMVYCIRGEKNKALSRSLLERLDEMANRHLNEWLGPEMPFQDSNPGDEIEIVRNPPDVGEVTGRFLRLDKVGNSAFGLANSSHPNRTMGFSPRMTIVRKLIRRTP